MDKDRRRSLVWREVEFSAQGDNILRIYLRRNDHRTNKIWMRREREREAENEFINPVFAAAEYFSKFPPCYLPFYGLRRKELKD